MTSSTVFKLTRWAAVAVAVLSGIAMLLYPGGTARNPSARGYSFFQNSLSDLGSTVAWDGQANSRGATFFVAGAILLALSGSGCLVALIGVYSSSRMASRFARAAGAAGLLTCAGLIGAALTPADRSPALHGQFTLLAIGTFPVATALLALATARDRRLSRRMPLGWLVLTLVLVTWASAMTWQPTTDLELTIPVTLQKVVAVTLLLVLTWQSYEAERVVVGIATTSGEPAKVGCCCGLTAERGHSGARVAERKTTEGGAMTVTVGCGTAKRNDRLFYTGMSIASILTVFVGFAPTYYLKNYSGAAPLTPLVHLHGLVFTSWILLFFAQNVLIASHQIRIHRRLGVAGAGLAAILVVVGLTTAVAFARRTVATGGAGTLTFLAIPFGDMFVFAILAGAGILYRRRPEMHKRLMLVATISLLGAAISRWPFAILQTGPWPFFVVTDLFVLAGACYDLGSRRQIHAAYVWGGLLLLISQPIRLAVGHTDTWLALAGWLAH